MGVLKAIDGVFNSAIRLGRKTAEAITLLFDNGAANPPGVRWNGTAMQYSNDGVIWHDIPSLDRLEQVENTAALLAIQAELDAADRAINVDFTDLDGVNTGASSNYDWLAPTIGPYLSLSAATKTVGFDAESGYTQEDVKGSFTFTVDSAYTSGHFSADISSTKIKAGCRMSLGGIIVTIISITGAGTAANSVIFTGDATLQGAITPDWIYGTVISGGGVSLSKYRGSTDITTTGQAISSGDYNGTTYAKENAFDNSTSTLWTSDLTGSQVAGAGYIGQDFGTPKTISKIKYTTYSSAVNNCPDIDLEVFDGSSWVLVQSYKGLSTATNVVVTLEPTTPIEGTKCRLLARAALNTGSTWAIVEMEMFELVSLTSEYYTTITSSDRIAANPFWSNIVNATRAETVYRENLLLHSGDLTQGVWSTDGASVSPNVATAPDGSTTADKIVESAASGGHQFNQQHLVADFGGPVTASIWLKAAERSRLVLVLMANGWTRNVTVDLDLSAGTASNVTQYGEVSNASCVVQPTGDGWRRVSLSAVYGAGSTGLSIFVFTVFGGATSYQGDGVSGYLVWGAQVERADAPGGYIPTTTTPATDSTGRAYYAVSFNNRQSFRVFTGGAWRTIASSLNADHGGTAGTWYYRDNASTWAAASTNAAANAISQAVAAGANNRVEGQAWSAVTQSEWSASGGFVAGTTSTIDVATTLYTTDAARVPSVDSVGIVYNQSASNMTLTLASFDVATYPTKIKMLAYVEPIDSLTVNTDIKAYVQEDTGQAFTQVLLASTNVAATKQLFVGEVDITQPSASDGASNTGTDYVTADMTAASTPSPNAVSATSEDSTCVAWKAFDRDTSSQSVAWMTAAGTFNTSTHLATHARGYEAIMYDFGSGQAKAINKYRHQGRIWTGGGQHPGAWTLQGGGDSCTVDDDTGWTTLHTISGVSYPGDDTWSSWYTFVNSTAYRKYRIRITESSAATNQTFVAFGELQFVESQPLGSYPYSITGKITSHNLKQFKLHGVTVTAV